MTKAARIKRNLTHFEDIWRAHLPKRLAGKPQTKRDVLRGLADKIASGDIRLRATTSGGAGKSEDQPAQPSSAPANRPKRTFKGSDLRLRDRVPVAARAPALAALDPAQQVDALKEAALSGAPFVEQCR